MLGVGSPSQDPPLSASPKEGDAEAAPLGGGGGAFDS